MGVIETKTFKSGNSVAVRLPKELGFAEDIAVTIERNGMTLTIKPAVDPVADKRKLTEMIKEIKAIWADVPRPKIDYAEERIEFPDRPGL